MAVACKSGRAALRTLGWIAAFSAAVALAACSPGGQPKLPPGAKLNTDLPMTEFMGHFVDPAAFMYWDNSGTVIDEKGEHSRYPTTDEGWDVLVTGATMLVEAGNALQLPGRPREPVADWNKYSRMLSERAMLARAAAEKRDEKAVFDEGGRVYEVCQACHEQFIIQVEQKANGAPKADPLPPTPGTK
jgi:hypothetical protein